VSTAPADFDAIVARPSDGEGDAPEPTGSRFDDWWDSRSFTVRRAFRWGAPVLVVIVAAIARLWNLGKPASLIFDETFYVKDGWTLWNLGYEARWPGKADELFNSGQVLAFTKDPSFVVHPPLGKWIIGLGMQILGPTNTVGWRISTAVVGILAVILLMVIARYLFNSMLLATVAGLLMAVDGNAIVMSRVAILDNSVMFFALLGFGAILLDRAWSARRLQLWLDARATAGRTTTWGPALWWRPWLIAAGVAFGATSAVKWSGLYFLAFFAVYTLVVDAVARRKAAIPFWLSGTILKQAPVTFLLMVPIALLTYLSTWTGWFLSTNGYSRTFADGEDHAWTGALAWVPHSLQSLWHFEVLVYQYNVGEMRPHAYQANPLSWLFMIRPTSMYYQSSSFGQNGCAVDSCGVSITGIANPLIWWAATAAAFYLTYRLARYREWRVGLILAGLAAGYLPWLLYLNRTVFQFYTIAFEPYLILALTLVIGMILGTSRDPRDVRTRRLRLVAIYFALVLVISAFYYPLWAGIQLDYWAIAAHWWLPTWR
jgi:dolichyl-phosphate-mannose--protein O-mannosyl transferase